MAAFSSAAANGRRSASAVIDLKTGEGKIHDILESSTNRVLRGAHRRSIGAWRKGRRLEQEDHVNF